MDLKLKEIMTRDSLSTNMGQYSMKDWKKNWRGQLTKPTLCSLIMNLW
jgi:hypothetical protein